MLYVESAECHFTKKYKNVKQISGVYKLHSSEDIWKMYEDILPGIFYNEKKYFSEINTGNGLAPLFVFMVTVKI